MRKDYILTPEEKQSKKQRLEQNRLLRSLSIKSESTTQQELQPVIEFQIILI